MKIKRLKIFSFAKFQSILIAGLGVLAGIIYSIGGLIIDCLVTLGWASPTYWETPGLSFGTILAMGALVGMPLIFAAFGYVFGLLEAIIYNLFSPRFTSVYFNFMDEDTSN